ncbi:hypothetical protein [Flavobacterium poyangense]|uniref:hypothetical protein n=1 Tax=Flavobacterium poyangense TaxID=2204302 RepID=UPI00141FCF76|nr:hypothetical protein [Flavobacterium sp. JXAS1]
MDNNIDFKDLWKKQSVSPPDMKELLAKLSRFKQSGLRKLVLTNALLVATCVFIVFIWYRYKPEFISTKIGIVLCVIAMVVYLFVANRLFGVYKRIDGTNSNTEYLQKLIEIKTKQKFLQSTMLSLYFIMLGVGLCLYMYEYASIMTQFWAVFSYVMLFLWLGFVWFYLRPKQIKKENAKINTLIEKFETINRQLTADS